MTRPCRLGLPVAEGKLEGPSLQQIDTQTMELRLPEGKLRELQTLIQIMGGAEIVSL